MASYSQKLTNKRSTYQAIAVAKGNTRRRDSTDVSPVMTAFESAVPAVHSVLTPVLHHVGRGNEFLIEGEIKVEFSTEC